MKIEKGIPIPYIKSKYEFLKSMEVGDSIVMDAQERNRLYSYGRGYQYKFMSKSTGNGTLRVWLTEKPEMEEK